LREKRKVLVGRRNREGVFNRGKGIGRTSRKRQAPFTGREGSYEVHQEKVRGRALFLWRKID